MYINTYTYSIYFENIYMSIYINSIVNKYISYINITYYSEIYTCFVFIYIYIINIHRTHTHTHYVKKKPFILDAINRLTALIYLYKFTYVCIYIFLFINTS